MENKPSPAYYAAVVVVNYDGQVLLGKRKEDGIWTTPGGSAEPEETNPAKTAVRELFEEAGIPADPRFLQPLSAIATRNGKFCHTFLYVVNSGIMTTSKLDPDEEVSKWKWFSMDKLPDGLKEDPRRFESVRNGFMKFHGITKSLIESLEKGGPGSGVKGHQTFNGKVHHQLGDGTWKEVEHPEEKQLKQEQNKNKVVSLTEKLKNKISEKNEISQTEKHLADLKNHAIIEGKETRSKKPMFTQVDSALAHGYNSADFREVGNVMYDRAQAVADSMDKLKATGQKVDPAFEKIKKLNMRMSKQFMTQANRIEDRQSKTASMTKSSIHIGHADAAEINTADFSMEHKHSMESEWLERLYKLMEGYQFGDEPRMMILDKGDLHLVKVDDGIYSGVFKKITPVDGGVLEDNAKVRLERMTLPTLVQFCLAKEWIETYPYVAPMTEPQITQLTNALEAPITILPTESDMDKRLRMLELISKLVTY